MDYFLSAGMAMAGFGLGIFVTLMTIKFEVGCRSRTVWAVPEDAPW